MDQNLLQAKAADGSETHYITSSSSYLRYYASALRSARERAPSLLPVLVVLNDMPQDFIDWVELQVRGAEQHRAGAWGLHVLQGCRESAWAAGGRQHMLFKVGCTRLSPFLLLSHLPSLQGGLVIHHDLSFAARMETTNDPWLRENLTKQLMASYARLDVPAIMEKVWAGACMRRQRAAGVEPHGYHACFHGTCALSCRLQVVAALPAYQRRWQKTDGGTAATVGPAEVDLDTVMWTDPDVLFRQDIDSCSLPMPDRKSVV